MFHCSYSWAKYSISSRTFEDFLSSSLYLIAFFKVTKLHIKEKDWYVFIFHIKNNSQVYDRLLKHQIDHISLFFSPCIQLCYSNNLLFSCSELIGSADFVEKGTQNVVFRTCNQEKNRVVCQLGTSDAVRALTAAQLV